MNKSLSILILSSLFILLTAFQCDDDDVSNTCEDRILHLNQMKAEIEAMAEASVCSEPFQCRYITFGSKPCGGPWEYLIYSTSIDTLQLTELVEEYNRVESVYNQTCDQFSDCSIENPPIRLECQNNTCIAIYE